MEDTFSPKMLALELFRCRLQHIIAIMHEVVNRAENNPASFTVSDNFHQ